ncbi:MAG: KEOPS complex subunit Pcc1 [Nanoarchaeota archaeon]
MSFSTVITLPQSNQLTTLLSEDIRSHKRSQATITTQHDTTTIIIKAEDFTALRATTNAIMQTIAIYTSIQKITL